MEHKLAERYKQFIIFIIYTFAVKNNKINVYE